VGKEREREKERRFSGIRMEKQNKLQTGRGGREKDLGALDSRIQRGNFGDLEEEKKSNDGKGGKDTHL